MNAKSNISRKLPRAKVTLSTLPGMVLGVASLNISLRMTSCGSMRRNLFF